MKAYMVQSPREVEPFGDHPRDCLILNRRLAEHQEQTLRQFRLDLEPIPEASRLDDPDEHIVFEDCVFFTPELLGEFITGSRRLQGSTVCSLKPGLVTLRSVVATQDVRSYPDRVEYGLRYFPRQEHRGTCQPLIVDPDQFSETVRFPEHLIGEGGYQVPLSDRLIVQVDHWVNLWAANTASLLADGARLKRTPAAKLLLLALRARSLNQWRVLQQLNRIGPSCDIHPTAYVEGSTIGKGVKIGAGSIVRESVVGDGTYIANNATVDTSVVGAGCTVLNDCVVQFSVLYPGTCTATRYVSLGLMGRDTEIANGVAFTDFRFDRRPVEVMKHGVRVDTANLLIGACVGHGAYLGAGCVVAPGRAIPNGWRIVPEASRVIETCRPDGVVGHRLLWPGESEHGAKDSGSSVGRGV